MTWEGAGSKPVVHPKLSLVSSLVEHSAWDGGVRKFDSSTGDHFMESTARLAGNWF